MPSKKQIKKKTDKCCYFCGESDYDLLDVHRILPGSENGKYVTANMVTCCALCHRKCHSGRIKIIGRHFSTSGKFVLHFMEDNVEKFK